MNTAESRPRVSILIPVYNWDLTLLIGALRTEIETAGLETVVEVKCFDDASTDLGLREANRALLTEHPKGWEEYREALLNKGRAKMRNDLADAANGDWLLFMDADVVPDSPKYLRNYIEEIVSDRADAVCGGTGYALRTMRGPEYDFYIYLVTSAGEGSAEMRNRIPWKYVLTSNMLIRREVFRRVPFDSRFVKYGYEDQEWGIRIRKSFRLLHIDNTVSHLGLQTKSDLYNKMVNSIENYDLLRQWHPAEFAESSIARVEQRFAELSENTLHRFDRLLKRWYFYFERPFFFPYLCYQINKAVLLALARQSRKSPPL